MKNIKNNQYNNDIKFYILCKYKEGTSVAVITKETGVSRSTVYKWIKQVELPVNANSEDYSSYVNSSKLEYSKNSQHAFNAVLITEQMNEAEVTDYCIANDIKREDLNTWRKNCMSANDANKEQDVEKLLDIIKQQKEENNKIKAEMSALKVMNEDYKNQIQELEHTTAALADIAICAKKAEAFFRKK